MYRKLGFAEVCRYLDPLEVTVMVLGDQLNYETDSNRLNHFLRPMVRRLLNRITFDPEETLAIETQASRILGRPITTASGVGKSSNGTRTITARPDRIPLSGSPRRPPVTRRDSPDLRT